MSAGVPATDARVLAEAIARSKIQRVTLNPIQNALYASGRKRSTLPKLTNKIMITKGEIQKFVEGKPSITREVFSSIASQPSDSSSHKIAIATSESFLKRYGERNSLMSPVRSNCFDFIHQLSLEEIEAVAKAESELEQRSIWQTLFIKPFKRFWIRLVFPLLGLDGDVIVSMEKNDKDSYYAIGDGIFWAGLYLIVDR